MQTVLITGAAGQIGSILRAGLKGAYPALRLTDLKTPAGLGEHETFVRADLADISQVEQAVRGAQSIVHLGGFPGEASWDVILSANIVGCYNVFEAARRAGVERIVFASSAHATGFYPRSRRIGPELPVRPDTRYGVSKALGESLGALYAYKHGLRVTCLRIGWCTAVPKNTYGLSVWASPEDLIQLVRIGLEHPDIRHEVFYGVSDNARSFWDNAAAHRYGYRPQGRAEDHAGLLPQTHPVGATETVAGWYQGGSFCELDFSGGIECSPT